VRLITPVTVPGRSSFTDVIQFHVLATGAFFETTGGVKLPLRFTLTMNLDTTGEWWRAPKESEPIVFDMTADYIQGFRDKENGRPTELHNSRWSQQRGATSAE
jgi:hypothetical protein